MSYNDPCTTDLSKFGWREKKIAAELLLAACEGLPDDFYDEDITIMFNTHSGNVFLTNSEFQVAMMNHNQAREAIGVDRDGITIERGPSLESFYSCPYCGEEGFKEDIAENHPEDLHPECRRFLVEIGALPTEDAEEEEE